MLCLLSTLNRIAMIKGRCTVINSYRIYTVANTENLKINVTQSVKHNDGNNMLLISNNEPGDLGLCVHCTVGMCACVFCEPNKGSTGEIDYRASVNQTLCNLLTGFVPLIQ